MIYDLISNLEFYTAFDKRFSIIAKYIKETDIDNLAEGSYEIGEGIKANVSEYETSKEDISWEGHRKYADLQYLHSGDEIIEWAPISELHDACEYSDEYDFIGGKCGDTEVSLTVTAGSFAYFAPCDLHKPGLYNKADKVKKIVFKIPVID